jgi:hypothetical protein
MKKRYLLLAALVAASCGNPNTGSSLKDDQAQVTGCEKADAMWNDKVLPSAYDSDHLPALTSPSLKDLITFLSASFVSKSITNHGDELEQGRHKLVHAWGTLARVRLDVPATAQHSYTGMLASGAPCGIARFSLAQAPTKTNSVPGLALKWFVDGNHESANIQVMYSIDGQDGHNFFEHPFANVIPEAKGFATRIIAKLFSRGAKAAGAADIAANHLKVTPMVATTAKGEDVESFNEPYKLVFEPTDTAKTFMDGATVDDDFRVRLAGIPVGTKLYEVYAYASDDAEPQYVGSLVTTSPVVAASYGDEKLFFKHTK